MSEKPKTKNIFSKEEIQNICSLGDVLMQIRVRLISESVSIDEAREKLSPNYKKDANM